MKIEKLTEDKVRITLNLEDLKSKNIDLHAFMSNSKETQSLFLEVLDEVERETGFVTKDYKLSIEAVAMQNGIFILTITRLSEPNLASHKKVHIKRKSVNVNHPIIIYKFDKFDDFCLLCDFVKNNEHINKMISFFDNVSLYYYNDYYLVIENANLELQQLKGVCSVFSEFGKYVNDSNLFEKKLKEYGNVIIEKNAIDTIIERYI